MSNIKFFGFFLFGAFMVLGFQNCGDGFSALDTRSNSSQGGGGAGGGTEIVPTTFTLAQVQQCSDARGLENLASCLDTNNANPLFVNQGIIDSCRQNVGEEVPAVVQCLANNGFPPAGYREPSQIDVDNCETNVGLDRLAVCLYNNGVLPDNIQKSQIDGCVDNVGSGRVEACLRSNELIADSGFLYFADVNACTAAHGPENLERCLDGKQLIPDTITQANIDTCITNNQGDASTVPRCLRMTDQLPRIIMQPHIGRCEAAVGAASIAACLELNGLLVAGVDQTVIDACIAGNGNDVGAVSRCLRARGLQSGNPVQANFDFCGRQTDPTNIANCLNASGVLIVGLTQENINSCLANVDVGRLQVCLEANGHLASFTQLASATGLAGMRCLVCHNNAALAANPGRRYSWEMFDSVVARVAAGDPDNSLIIQRMMDANNPMPPGGLLPAADVERMRKWISQGAVQEYGP